MWFAILDRVGINLRPLDAPIATRNVVNRRGTSMPGPSTRSVRDGANRWSCLAHPIGPVRVEAASAATPLAAETAFAATSAEAGRTCDTGRVSRHPCESSSGKATASGRTAADIAAGPMRMGKSKKRRPQQPEKPVIRLLFSRIYPPLSSLQLPLSSYRPDLPEYLTFPALHIPIISHAVDNDTRQNHSLATKYYLW